MLCSESTEAMDASTNQPTICEADRYMIPCAEGARGMHGTDATPPPAATRRFGAYTRDRGRTKNSPTRRARDVESWSGGRAPLLREEPMACTGRIRPCATQLGRMYMRALRTYVLDWFLPGKNDLEFKYYLHILIYDAVNFSFNT